MAFSAGFDFFAGRFFRVVFCWVATMGPDPMCQVGKAVRLVAKISR